MSRNLLIPLRLSLTQWWQQIQRSRFCMQLSRLADCPTGEAVLPVFIDLLLGCTVANHLPAISFGLLQITFEACWDEHEISLKCQIE